MSDSWLQILPLFLANTRLLLWFRAESRANWRHMDAKLDASIKSIQEEIKDFHRRLCAIEEGRKNGQ